MVPRNSEESLAFDMEGLGRDRRGQVMTRALRGAINSAEYLSSPKKETTDRNKAYYGGP